MAATRSGAKRPASATSAAESHRKKRNASSTRPDVSPSKTVKRVKTPTSRHDSSARPPDTKANKEEAFTQQQQRQAKQLLNAFLSALKSTSTMCPSQLARRLTEVDPGQFPDWRALMPAVRDLVWDCVEQGWAEVTQRGEVRRLEDREGIKGPIRVRRGRNFDRSKD